MALARFTSIVNTVRFVLHLLTYTFIAIVHIMSQSRSAASLAQSMKSSQKLKIENLFSVQGWVAVGEFDSFRSLDLYQRQSKKWLICIVTGGGTGLGLVTANALAENGARVYISGRREGPLKEAARKIEGTTGEIIAIVADASTKEGITSEHRIMRISTPDR